MPIFIGIFICHVYYKVTSLGWAHIGNYNIRSKVT